MRNIACALLITTSCCGIAHAQDTPPAPPAGDQIPLTVMKGTPLRVALENEITVKKVGQPVQGRVVEPVYAFDHLVIPIGSEVFGKIAEIEGVNKEKRLEALMNADFTPARSVRVEFDELVLPDGKHIPLETVVTPGTAEVVHLTTAKPKEQEKKNVVSKDLEMARSEINKEWEAGMSQVKTPGQMHRLERFLIIQLPVHPQYVAAGTRFNAELQAPLDFGTKPFSVEAMPLLGTPPPPGDIVHALLVTPLSSATAKQGMTVEAVLSQPLFSPENKLILPEGTRLEGAVVQARPARGLKRNGELRITFRKLTLPDGVERKIDAGLEGVEVGREDNMELDAEGGAHSTNSKTRYLSTGISIALAATSALPDFDAGAHGASVTSNSTGLRAAAGGTGYRAVGMTLSLLVHSRVFSASLGAYGAGLSIYTHFLSRGQDVVFPKNTPMDIGFGERGTKVAAEKIPGQS
jgi:hypothetical protein